MPRLSIQRPRCALSLLGLISLFGLAACGQPSEPAAGGSVTVYASRHYDTDLEVYDRFTAETGVRVNVIEADSDALIERMASEGELSPADVLVTVDAGRLWRAEQRDILQPVASDVLVGAVPAHFRHPDGLWYGLAKRVRVIIYNPNLVAAADIATYADLADPTLNGLVCMRSSSNIYNTSLLAAFIAHDGEAAAEAWASGVVANFARPPAGNDTAQIRAVAAGECGVSLVNSYYVARLAASEDAADQAAVAAIGVIFPDQDGRGAHANISGAGVAKHAPHRDNAIRLLEFILDADTQALFANGNQEYPIVVGLDPSPQAQALGAFKEDQLNASALGENQAAAVRVFDRAGWR